MSQVINLSLLPHEGEIVRLMLEAALEQVTSASDEERRDPVIQLIAQTCNRLIPYLPKA